MSSLPDDPFGGVSPSGFENFSPELQEFVRTLDRAKPVVRALLAAESFEQLARAVFALDSDERTAALVVTFIDLRRQMDPDWREWVER